MYDVTTDADDATYECLNCGTLVRSESHPVECPDCGESVQNRGMSLE